MSTPTLRAIARHAVRTFPMRAYTDPGAVRHLRRRYIRARVILGERWVLAQQVARKAHERRDALVLAVTVAGALPIFVHDVAIGIAIRVLA